MTGISAFSIPVFEQLDIFLSNKQKVPEILMNIYKQVSLHITLMVRKFLEISRISCNWPNRAELSITIVTRLLDPNMTCGK